MRNSSRSAVDPFIVMDVMEVARRAEAAGRRIIHMEVGQPATGAPKGATQALAKSEAKLKAILASSIAPMVMVDFDGILTYINPSFLKVWKYGAPFEVQGTPETVISRGKIIVDNCQYVGNKGHGQFLKRGFYSGLD